MIRVTVLAVSLVFAMLLAAAAATPSFVRPVLAQLPSSCDWTGVWLPFEGEWRFAQNGTGVSGSYLDGKGFVSGTVDGDVLRGEWKEPPSYNPPFDAGHFTVTLSSDCSSFNGTWGLGDAECCNVLSAVRDEDPPPSLAVQVEQGKLIVDGQTILPGQTYFPPSCPPAGRSTDDFCASLVADGLLDQPSAVKFTCFLGQFIRVLAVVETVNLSEKDSDLLIDIITVTLLEKCGISNVRQDGWALDLAVREGTAHVRSVVDNQKVRVEAGPATANLSRQGSFVAGYDPEADKATFHTHSTPLDVQPQIGSAFILPPYSRVEVTRDGPGPVTSLSLLYLPMQNR